ncbi:MAG: ABC-F family ATP-binding cassette domain-containing protein [Acutalibacteraceae bacterium]|jgi:ATP-binding cassette subfamily F protein 3
MQVLTAHHLLKTFGERVLFEDVSFDVQEHEKVGLVGANGCGKTTLFKMLIGEESVDGGDVVTAKNTRLGYAEQHACADSERTLWDEVETVFAPVIAVERELQKVERQLEVVSIPDLLDRQHQLREQLEAMGGLYYKSRLKATLLGLGFDEQSFTQPVATLSGGQRSKAAMAKLLLSDSNLLLLDEPTNHLDIPSVEWLEEFLRGYTGAVVVISHDRYFLDKVTTRTLELTHGRMVMTRGNYSAHREARKKEKEVAAHHYKSASRKIRHVEESIERFRQFNREKSIRAAESKEKMLERLKAELEIPEGEEDVIRFDFTVRATSGNEVLDVQELAMGFEGRELFHDVNFKLWKGQRVFLLGPNGCGKTTLLKILNHRLRPRHGFVRQGAKVSIGYYDQTQQELDGNKTAIEAIWDQYPALTQTELRNAMAAFLFRGEDVFQPVSVLSGGERARLLLLKLMLARDNLLLLDEPTNHLDIASREALEDALSGYDGTMLIVSHDRYFINRMADKVIALRPDGCLEVEGDYDAYLARADQPQTAAAPVKPARENAYKQRKEQESARRKLATRVRRAEEAVAAAEEEIASLHARLEDPAVQSDYQRITDLSAALEEQESVLAAQMEEWETAQRLLEEMQ